jgi:mRNA interferase MazF
MKRGDIVLASAGSGYVGKPRPVVVVQDAVYDNLTSVVVCPLSTSSPIADPLRIGLIPNSLNGLEDECAVMVDKVSAVPRTKLGVRIGEVDHKTLMGISRGLASLIGLGS